MLLHSCCAFFLACSYWAAGTACCAQNGRTKRATNGVRICKMQERELLKERRTSLISALLLHHDSSSAHLRRGALLLEIDNDRENRELKSFLFVELSSRICIDFCVARVVFANTRIVHSH